MFETIIVPRIGETDILGHITHTSIPGYLEAARKPIFEIFQPDLDASKLNLIIAHLEIDFLCELRHTSEITIKTRLVRVGRSSFEMIQDLWQRDQKRATARAVMVRYDYAAKKSYPISEDIRCQLEAHVASADDGSTSDEKE